jgi:hypothetical protein
VPEDTFAASVRTGRELTATTAGAWPAGETGGTVRVCCWQAAHADGFTAPATTR